MNNGKANFFMMENISKFLEACTAYGLQKADQFHTAALFERTNMTQVVYTLHALGRAVSAVHSRSVLRYVHRDRRDPSLGRSPRLSHSS